MTAHLNMERVTQKVAAYITCDDRLLLFSHVDFPDAGIQVPAGTVAEGETPEEAVLREASEETGLSDLKIESLLGARIYDLRPLEGRNIVVKRHYFHLSIPGPAEIDRWRHWEMYPSDGAAEPIHFELFWARIPDGVPELSGNLGDMLDRLPDLKH